MSDRQTIHVTNEVSLCVNLLGGLRLEKGDEDDYQSITLTADELQAVVSAATQAGLITP